MLNIYDYLSESDKSMFMLESVCNNRIERRNHEFDMFMLEHSQNLQFIEDKVLLENGTEDDLVTLYTVEAEESTNKGKGLLSSIFSAIIGFFKRIKNAIFGNKKSMDPNNLPDQVDVPGDFNKLKNENNKLLGGIGSFLHGNKGELTSILGLALGGTVAVKIGKKLAGDLYEDIEEYTNEVEDKLTNFQEMSEKNQNLTPEDQNIIKKAINRVKMNGAKILDISKAIFKAGDGDFKNIHDKNKNKRLDAKDDEKIQKHSDEIDKNNKTKESLRIELAKIDPMITKLEDKLKVLTKQDNKVVKKIKDKFNIGDENKLKTLERKGDNRTNSEEREYQDLKNKVNGNNNDLNNKIKDIQDTINKLRLRGKEINDEINNLNNINSNINNKKEKVESKKEARHNKNGNSSNTNNDIIGHANELLNESVLEFVDSSDIESLIKLL